MGNPGTVAKPEVNRQWMDGLDHPSFIRWCRHYGLFTVGICWLCQIIMNYPVKSHLTTIFAAEITNLVGWNMLESLVEIPPYRNYGSGSQHCYRCSFYRSFSADEQIWVGNWEVSIPQMAIFIGTLMRIHQILGCHICQIEKTHILDYFGLMAHCDICVHM